MKLVICLAKSRIVNKISNNYLRCFFQFIAVLCLVLSTNGAPQQNRRPIALAKVTNQGTSIATAFGN